MKKTITTKRLFLAALLTLTAASQAFALEDEITWVKAVAYPTGAGTVYTSYSNDPTDEKTFGETSEFKRYTNGAIRTTYIWTELTNNDYQFAGVARDGNGNGVFDNDASVDKQVKIDADGYFKNVPYDEVYKGDSSTECDAKAQEALDGKTTPSDVVFAVFTKGAIAKMAVGQEEFGHIWSSKLSTEVGDKVQFVAYGDSKSQDGGGVKYYKFDHWENAAGQNMGSNRVLEVTVQGKEVYYACVVETDAEGFQTEKDPLVDDSQSGTFPWDTSIKNINTSKVDNTYFDLQGRRVAKATKGIFIQNGKKVVVK